MANEIQLQSNAQTARKKDRQGRDLKVQDHSGVRASSAAGSDVMCFVAFRSAARDAIT